MSCQMCVMVKGSHITCCCCECTRVTLQLLQQRSVSVSHFVGVKCVRVQLSGSFLEPELGCAEICVPRGVAWHTHTVALCCIVCWRHQAGHARRRAQEEAADDLLWTVAGITRGGGCRGADDRSICWRGHASAVPTNHQQMQKQGLQHSDCWCREEQ